MKRSILNRNLSISALLFSGIIALVFVLFFVILNLHTIVSYHQPYNFRTEQIIKVNQAIKASKPYELNRTIRALNNQWVHLIPQENLNAHSNIILSQKPGQIRQQVHNPNQLLYSILLPNGHWLLIKFTAYKKPVWIISLLSIFILFILIGLFVFCFLTVRYLNKPTQDLKTFLNHAKEDNNHDATIPEYGSADLKAIIKSINMLITRNQHLLKNRTEILAAISHDLRTPITRIKFRVESIDNASLQDKITDDLTEMENMLYAVLDYLRNNLMEQNFEWFDLNTLLESIQNEYADTGVNITYEGTSSRTAFFGNVDALKRAFSNLIENAKKYGSEISMKLLEDKKQLTIQIDDNGPGIPSHELKRIFDPFYRVEKSRNRTTGGAGLGLAIVKDIINSHQGSIELLNLKKGLRAEILFSSDQKKP
jgi:signal transduction histidine kinase